MTIIPDEVHLDVLTADIVEANSWAAPHPLNVCFATLHSDDGNWLWDASAALCLVKGFSNATVSGRCDASLKADGTMRLAPSALGCFRTVSLTGAQTTYNENLLLQYLGTVMWQNQMGGVVKSVGFSYRRLSFRGGETQKNRC